MNQKLARVRWEMGQTLLPGHLEAQEESLATEVDARLRNMGLPYYGLVRLQWNETMLPEGVLAVQSLTAIMPSGLFLDIPGNTRAEPMNLNNIGSVQVPVYMHLVIPGHEQQASSPHLDEPGDIPRKQHFVIFSSDQAQSDALESLRLGLFYKDPQGTWQLSSGSIPPFLQVGRCPFLQQELKELEQLLEVFQQKLSQEIAASYLSGDSMFSARECLKSSIRTGRMLANISAQYQPHPFYLYEALKEFLTDVALYRDMQPEHVLAPYDHEALGKCFQNILEPLKEHMRQFQRRATFLPFEFKDGLHQVDLPGQVKEAKEFYLLVQKSHVHAAVSLQNLKLGGRSRLSTIHRLALQGIPLKKIERPPFQHKFGPEVDFYQLQPGEEWDQALRDLSLAFYDMPAFSGVRFFVYWRGA